MIKLSPHQRIIAWRLALQPLVLRVEIIEALWGAEGGPLGVHKIIDVRIHQLRRKLPSSIQISTRWGLGYFVPVHMRAALLQVLADEIAADGVTPILTVSQYFREAA